MRKLFFAITITLSLFAISTANAQQGKNNPDRQEKQKEWMKQRYKDSLGFSEEKAAKVADIQSSFGPQLMEVRRDQTLSQADKQTKLKDINAKMDAQLKTVLNDEEFTKFREFQKKGMNRMKSHSGSQGGGGMNQMQQ